MAKLSVGSKVEVACEDDGYLGSWFDATIIGHEGNKFTIEYENLLEEDMRSPCKERVKMSQVRPRPPQLPEDDPGRWLPGHAVEAHWHDGWWQGVIDKRLAKDSFQVYFQNTSERLTFSAKNIRTRMDWGEGGWVVVTAASFSPRAHSTFAATSTVTGFTKSRPPAANCGRRSEETPKGRSPGRDRMGRYAGNTPPVGAEDSPNGPLTNSLYSIRSAVTPAQPESNGWMNQEKRDLADTFRQAAGSPLDDFFQPWTPQGEVEPPAKRHHYVTGGLHDQGNAASPPGMNEQWTKEQTPVHRILNRETRAAALHGYRAVVKAFHQQQFIDYDKSKIMADLRLALGISNNYHVNLLRHLAASPTAACCTEAESLINEISHDQSA